MATEERYNGWTNRETWAVALYVNNDQGWQESVLDALRDNHGSISAPLKPYESYSDAGETWDEHEVRRASQAGDIIRDNVEDTLDMLATEQDRTDYGANQAFVILRDIGSLWRVNWTELGASFLEDLEG